MSDNPKVIVEAIFNAQKTKSTLQSQLNQIGSSLKLSEKNLNSKRLLNDFEKLANFDLSKSKLKLDIQNFINDNGKLSNSFKNTLVGISEQVDGANKLKLGNLRKEFQNTSAEAKLMGQTGDTVLQRYTKNLKEFFTFLSAGGLIMGAFHTIDSVIKNVKELDKSLVNLQMATGGTYEETSKLVKQYNEMAIALGATTKEVTDSADSWLRQGKSVEDTNTLIKDSLVLSKVGQLDSAEATQYLTSVTKGYKVSVEDTIDVIDALSAVDLQSATSAGGLAQALSRTSNVANISGVSLNKLIGYVATVGEVTQKSMDEVGTSFQAIFSRMGNVKAGKFVDDETGESLNDVQKVLGKVGIQLKDGASSFRNFGDVLDDVSSKWDTFNDIEKNAVGTAIAGTRQRENFTVLMENYSTALKYTETASNSAGTAMKKFENYENSTEAATKRLTAQFEKLSLDTLNGNFVKAVINSGTSILSLIDALGGLIPVVVALGLAFAGLKLPIIYQSFGKLVELIAYGTVTTGAATIAVGGFTISIQALTAAVTLGLSVAIMGAVAAFKYFNVTLEEQQQKVAEITSKYNDLNEELKALQDKKATSAADTPLTSNEQARLEYLEKYVKYLKEQKQLESNTEAQKYSKSISDDISTESTKVSGREQLISPSTFETNENGTFRFAKLLDSTYKEITDSQVKLLEFQNEISNRIESTTDTATVDKLKQQLDSVNSAIEKNEYFLSLYENKGYIKIDIDTSDVQNASDNIQDLGYTSEELSKTLEDSKNSIDGLASSAKTLSSAFAEQKENGKLSTETILEMVDAGYAAALSVDKETGAVTLNKDAYLTLAKAKIEEQMASLQLLQTDLRKKYNEESEAAREAARSHLENAQALYEEARATGGQYRDVGIQIAALDELKNSLGQVVAGNYAVASSAKSAAKDIKQAYSSANSAINSLLSTTISMLKQKYQDADTAHKESIQNRIDNIKDLMEAEKEEAEEDYNAKQKQIQAQLDLLQAQKDTHDYEKSLSEKETDKSKIQAQIDALQFDTSESAQKLRNQLIEELNNTTSEIDELQYNRGISLQEDALNSELSRIKEIHDAEIDSIEDTYNAKITRLQDQLDAVEDNAKTEAQIRTEAMNLINQGGQKLYNDLIEYNRQFGTSVDNDIRVQWDNCYQSLKAFGNGQIDVLSTLNSLALKMNDFDLATQSAASSMDDLAKAIRDKNDAENEAKQKADYTRSWQQALAKAGGLSGTQYKGYSNGGVVDYTGYAMLHGTSSSPELVLNAKDVNKVYNFIHGNTDLMEPVANSILSTVSRNLSGLSGSISSVTNNSNLSSNPIINLNITGDATPSTVQALKNATSDIVNTIKKDVFGTIKTGAILGY